MGHSVLCHLPSSRDHVDIHKKVKMCPLVPSGAVKYILHVSKRPCRQNKLQLFEKKNRQNLFNFLTSCDWAVNVT